MIKKLYLICSVLLFANSIFAKELSDFAYLVYRDGNQYIAKSFLDNKEDLVSKDSHSVIQHSIDNSEGGIVHIKNGDYEIDKPIILREKLAIEGEGYNTRIIQKNKKECAFLFIGGSRANHVKNIKKAKQNNSGVVDVFGVDPTRIADDWQHQIRYYEKYGVTSRQHFTFLRISDLNLVGPGIESDGDGIRLEYANSYLGPCLIERMHIRGFGGWQICAHQCWGGAFVIRDSKIGGSDRSVTPRKRCGGGVYLENCHGASIRDCEIHDLNEGLWIRNGYAIVVSGVVSEKISGKAFASLGRASVLYECCYAEMTKYGVYVQDTEGPTTIQSCFLWSKYPIYLNDTDNIMVTGNKLQCEADDGFNITSNHDCKSLVRFVNQSIKGFEYSRMNIPALENDSIVNLDSNWLFRPDYKNEGVKGEWFKSSKWVETNQKQIVVGKDYGWEKQGFPDLFGPGKGFGWYKVNIDKDIQKKYKYLYFSGVDEEAFIYFNGKKVAEHSRENNGMSFEQLWDDSFVVDITDYYDSSKVNELVVRVYNNEKMGGMWKPVLLISSDASLNEDSIALGAASYILNISQ